MGELTQSQMDKNLKMFYALTVISSVYMGVFMTFVGIYLMAIGYGESLVGSILSLNTICIAIGCIPSVIVIEKLGRKKSFALGFLLISVGLLAIVINSSYWCLIFMAIVNGFGQSVRATIEAVFLAENTSNSNRSKAFNMNYIMSYIGMMSASFIGGYASSYFEGIFDHVTALMIIFVATGVLGILSVIPISQIKETSSVKTRNVIDTLKGFKVILKPRVRGMVIFYSLIGMGAGCVVPFFAVYLRNALGFPDKVVGSITSFSQFGCILGGLVIPFLVAKIGKVKSIILCEALSLPFLLSIAFPQGLIVIYISFFMRNGLMNMAMPIIQNISMEIVEPEERTNISSSLSISWNITRAIGIGIGGTLMENVSYNFPYYVTIFMYTLAIYVFYKATKGLEESQKINY